MFIAETTPLSIAQFTASTARAIATFHERLLFFKKTAENVIDCSLVRRGPDADAKSWNLFRPKLNNDRFKAVVATRAAVFTNAQASKRKGEVVENNEYFCRRDLIKIRDGSERLAASIHEGRGLEQNASIRFRP